MGAVVDLVNCQLVCKELNSVFPLQIDPPGKGLPEGATYESVANTVPDGISTNALTKVCSTLQYTVFNGTIAPAPQATYSSNIVVNDCFFQDCISRELVYHSPRDATSE